MSCESSKRAENVLSNIPFNNQQKEVEDLQNRIRRILEHPDVPQEFKEEFKNNNFIQLFEKNFGSVIKEGGR